MEGIRGLFRSLFKIWFLFSFLNDSILKNKKKPRWQPRLAFHINLNILAFSEMSKSGTSNSCSFGLHSSVLFGNSGFFFFF